MSTSFMWDDVGDNNWETAHWSRGEMTIVAATAGTPGSFEVGSDQTTVFSAGVKFRVFGSTGNDGEYTVVSSSYSAGPNTTIDVASVADGTDDGSIVLQPAWPGDTESTVDDEVYINASTHVPQSNPSSPLTLSELECYASVAQYDLGANITVTDSLILGAALEHRRRTLRRDRKPRLLRLAARQGGQRRAPCRPTSRSTTSLETGLVAR